MISWPYPIASDPRGVPHYIVEGLEHPDPESDRSPDGEHAPFMLFLPGAQDHLPGHFETRKEAQAVADILNRAAVAYRKARGAQCVDCGKTCEPADLVAGLCTYCEARRDEESSE